MAEGKSSMPGGSFLNQSVSNPDEFMTNMAKVMDHTATIARLLAKKAETAGQPGDAIGGQVLTHQNTSERVGNEMNRCTRTAALERRFDRGRREGFDAICARIVAQIDYRVTTMLQHPL